MLSKQPIFVTGVERSGSTLITRVLQLCGANASQVNKMRENVSIRALNHDFINENSEDCFMPDLDSLELPLDWKEKINTILKQQRIPESMPFVYKDSGLTQIWPLWHDAYPDAKWIIVRRRTGDIVHSFEETAYMDKFKSKHNCELVGAMNEREGWLWWVHQYEDRFRDMIAANLNYKIVWPERMRDANFEQMKEVVEWCELGWNEEVEVTMKNLLNP